MEDLSTPLMPVMPALERLREGDWHEIDPAALVTGSAELWELKG